MIGAASIDVGGQAGAAGYRHFGLCMSHPLYVGPNEFVPPLFHFSDDLAVFDSLYAMTRYIEPWDVEESARAFDCQGRRIVLRGVGVRRTRWSVGGGDTLFDAERSGERRPEELAELLREYVHAAGPERFGLRRADVDSTPLDALVTAVGRKASE